MPTPTLVQHLCSGRDSTTISSGSPTISVYPLTPTLLNNCLILVIEWDASGGISAGTPTDNKSNTWTPGPTRTDSGQAIAMFYVLGATAGVNKISIVMSGGTSSVCSISVKFSEFYNVQTSGAIDTSGSANAKSISITTGSSGDLIYQVGNDISSLTPGLSSITKGTNYTLLSSQLVAGTVAQFKVAGAAGPETVAFTTSGSDSWSSVCAAFKSVSAGTAPTGLYVKHAQVEAVPSSLSNVLFPSDGNLFVTVWAAAITGATAGTPSGQISSLTDSKSNNWQIGNASGYTGGAGNPQIAQIMYAQNATGDNPLTVNFSTATINGSISSLSMMMLYDVVGALVSAHDQDVANSGNQTSGGNLGPDTITPSTSYGIAFDLVTINVTTVTAIIGGLPYQIASLALNSNNNNQITGGTPASSLNDDDPRGIAIYNSRSSLTFTYSHTGTGAGVWWSAASTFSGTPLTTTQVQNFPAGADSFEGHITEGVAGIFEG